MKLLPQIALVVLLSIATTAVTARFLGSKEGAQSVKETAYDRVMRTGVLRCGYADFPPYLFTKDPTSGKRTGIFVETTEAVADKLGLKVEWAEDTGWGNLVESLRTHRVDAFCAGKWRDAHRGRYIAYGMPLFYMSVYPYVRVNDHRFDKDLSAINSPEARISAMDGEMSDLIAKQHFPKATAVSVPELGQITDIFLHVANNKADVVFNDSAIADAFIKANPGKLRRAQDAPYQVFPTSLVVDLHERALLDMLDSAVVELEHSGAIDAIVAKYTKDPKVLLRLAKPYREQ
ncbi:MAG: transporter substrate-binding domain-containing protein [Alphaproteobacteria bacterium]|nr:transporter substrate-binding domain-containing protein [Alphaproteobacteria bacterium]